MLRFASRVLPSAPVSRSTFLFRQPSVSRCFSTTQFRRADDKPSSSGGSVLNLRFTSPNETLVNNKPVYAVTVPSTTGMMGILAEHEQTIVQLKPGVVTVHGNDINDVTHRYFVSGGFATVKDSTAAVTAVEAVKLDDLDASLARKGLEDSQQALAKAANEKEKAEAQIGIDVNEAIVQALEAKA